MQKQFSNLIGIFLVLLGALSLAFNLAAPRLGAELWHGVVWRFWPLTVIAAGGGCLLLPWLARRRIWLGPLLMMAGMTILTTGAILLLASMFNYWGIWTWLWPLEVLGAAAGFLLAAIYARSIWLAAVAVIIGLTGAALQFCALTGLWAAWAVIWPITPLAVGLGLLLVGLVKRSNDLFVAALILCGLAGVGFIGTTTVAALTTIWPGLPLFHLAGPVILMLVGGLLLAWNALRQRTAGLV